MPFLTTIVALAGRHTLLNQHHELDLGQVEHRWDGSGAGCVLAQGPVTTQLKFQVLLLSGLADELDHQVALS